MNAEPHPTKQWLETSVLRDAGEFASLEEEWDDLYRNSPRATPFQSWAWLYSWWESYGEGYELRLIVVRNGALLVGLLPLMVRRGLSFGRLLFVGNGKSTYLVMLVREGWEGTVVEAGAATPERMDSWQVADLQDLRTQAAAWDLFRNWAGLRACAYQAYCTLVEAKPWDELLASVSKSLRRVSRQTLRENRRMVRMRWSKSDLRTPAMTGNSVNGRSVLVALAVVVVLLAVGCSAPSSVRQPYLFALIGNDGTHLAQEREAGINAKILRLSWRNFYLAEGKVNTSYVKQKKEELRDLREMGFEAIASLNYHDTPLWVHENYSDSYYVNQFGERWTGTNYDNGQLSDNGDANLVFNPRLRALIESYTEEVFSNLGTDFWAVRLGGGRYGEVSYPPDHFRGKDNLYWAYDKNAQRSAMEAGVGGWKPGDPSPTKQADRFLNWYLDSLVGFQNWQVSMVRRAGYSGKIMLLYPGRGIRPREIEEATATNLDGSTPAEVSGEIQRGHDFARQVGAIEDHNALVTTTWLDAPASGDDSRDPRHWTPVKYLSYLAEFNPTRPGLYGENTGAGSREDMQLSASQMQRYQLLGMAWYDEEQLFSGRYATLEDYERVIRCSQKQTGLLPSIELRAFCKRV